MVASAAKIVHARGTAYGVRMDSLTHYAGKVCALVRNNTACDLVVGHRGCKTCLLLNDQPVTALTPPLHKGCACTVDKWLESNNYLTH